MMNTFQARVLIRIPAQFKSMTLGFVRVIMRVHVVRCMFVCVRARVDV